MSTPASPAIAIKLHWTGSTAAARYPHHARASAAGKPDLATGVGPAFGGTGEEWDPEDLFGAALSTCLMFTFLALARKVRLDVVDYADTVTLTMVTEDRRTRVSRAVVSPVVTLAAGDNLEKAETMFHKSHKYCVMANSTSAEVVLEPVFQHAAS